MTVDISSDKIATENFILQRIQTWKHWTGQEIRTICVHTQLKLHEVIIASITNNDLIRYCDGCVKRQRLFNTVKLEYHGVKCSCYISLANSCQPTENAYDPAGPAIYKWNSLPEHLRISHPTLNSFKCSLKIQLHAQMTHRAHKGRFPLPEFTGRDDGPSTRMHF